MKLVMTLLVRDEIDIIRENIDFHRAAGVDHVVVTDNGSVDGTLEVIEDYVREGVVTLIREPSDSFSQAEWVTRMVLIARDTLGADWILNNDADEFWFAPGNDLKAAINAQEADILTCARTNMLAPWPKIGTAPWPEVLRWRARWPVSVRPPKDIYAGRIGLPLFCYRLPPKVLVRARGLAQIDAGNHGAEFLHTPRKESSEILIYHFPMRNLDRFARNTWNKGEASERVPRPGRENWKSRRWYRMMEADGSPARIFSEAMPGQWAFWLYRLTGYLVRDDTVYRILSEQHARLPGKLAARTPDQTQTPS